MFTFANVYGSILQASEAAVEFADRPFAHPHEVKFVSGQVWKNAMGLDSDKSKSVRLADELFPGIKGAWKKTSRTSKASGEYTSAAEACLIAFYGVTMQHQLRGRLRSKAFYRDFKLDLRTPQRVKEQATR